MGIGAGQILFKINFDGEQIGDIEGAKPGAVLLGGDLDAALEIVTVITCLQPEDELVTVSG